MATDYPDKFDPKNEWEEAVLIDSPKWTNGKEGGKGYWFCQVKHNGASRRWFMGPLGEAVDMFNQVGLAAGSEFAACCPENFRIDLSINGEVYSSKNYDRDAVESQKGSDGGGYSGGGNRGGGNSGGSKPSPSSPPPPAKPAVTDFPGLFNQCFSTAKKMCGEDAGNDTVWRIGESLFNANIAVGVYAPKVDTPSGGGGGGGGGGAGTEEDDLPF